MIKTRLNGNACNFQRRCVSGIYEALCGPIYCMVRFHMSVLYYQSSQIIRLVGTCDITASHYPCI